MDLEKMIQEYKKIIDDYRAEIEKQQAQMSDHSTEIEALREENATLKEENSALKEVVVALTAKLEELEARQKKNSRNSNNPPTSDGPKKPNATRSLREKSGRTTGGQKGHKGATLELSPTPDTVVELKPQDRCDCGGQIIATENTIVKQVTTLDLPKKITIEYRAQDGICEDCGKLHRTNFPEGIEGTVSYGESVHAILTYLTNYQLLPLKRATELMNDLFGLEISQATILTANQEAYEKLENAEAHVRDELINSDVVGFDETSMRVDGKQHWLHCAGTSSATLYTLHKKRGNEGMDAQGILPVFKGTAVHDHWKAYYKYMCAHSECNAHHLRHLIFLYEVMKQEWAGEMIALLLRIKEHVDLSKVFGSEELLHEDISEYEQMYRRILEAGAASIGLANPYGASDSQDNHSAAVGVGSKKGKKTEPERMIIRLSKYEQETLMFMYDFNVPFDNNAAERDVRMPKVRQKISGCFRTVDGGNTFARIRGFISTTKKKGKKILNGLIAAFQGKGEGFLYPEVEPN